jgi:hypothetical protein
VPVPQQSCIVYCCRVMWLGTNQRTVQKSIHHPSRFQVPNLWWGWLYPVRNTCLLHCYAQVKFDEVCYLPGCPVEHLPRWLRVSTEAVSSKDPATSAEGVPIVHLPPALGTTGERSRKRDAKEQQEEPLVPGTAVSLTPQQAWEIWRAVAAHAERKRR